MIFYELSLELGVRSGGKVFKILDIALAGGLSWLVEALPCVPKGHGFHPWSGRVWEATINVSHIGVPSSLKSVNGPSVKDLKK